MPARVAARFNTDLTAKYRTLLAAAKPAITALMRKLIGLANALLRDDPSCATQPN
jgi:transposase